MKCFEKLVLHHIKSCLPPHFDPCQFAYRAKRSLEDAIATTMRTILSYLQRPNSYVIMLFINFSVVVNTVILYILIFKLLDLGQP